MRMTRITNGCSTGSETTDISLSPRVPIGIEVEVIGHRGRFIPRPLVTQFHGCHGKIMPSRAGVGIRGEVIRTDLPITPDRHHHHRTIAHPRAHLHNMGEDIRVADVEVIGNLFQSDLCRHSRLAKTALNLLRAVFLHVDLLCRATLRTILI
jgi:hypothetical protein